MAAANVGRLCAPTLLALKQAGLEYLLLDERQAQAIRNSAREAARQPEVSGVRELVAQVSPATRMLQNPVRDLRDTSDSGTMPREAPSRIGSQASQAPPGFADWPAAWQEQFKKIRAAPVVWTYWELGQDLCGSPDPKRRELLQELLKSLAHPPGTHSFWPVALPDRGGDGEQRLEANAPVFWEGVRLLHGRAVVIMGSQALSSLALPEGMLAMRPFQQLRHQGRLLIVLHSPDILNREPQRMQALREFLRQALAPFA